MCSTTGKSGSYTVIASNSHAPSEILVDLDYPMYGDVRVKCNGKRYTLREVRAAMKLVDAAREVR